MTFQGAFEISSLKLPDLYGPVFRRGRQLGVLWMKSQRCDVGLVAFECEFGRSLGQVQIFKVGVDCSLFLGSFREIVLKVFDLFFEVGNFFLKGEDGLPFEF